MRFWLVVMIGGLALVGLWVTLSKLAAGAERLWAWLVRDRVTPLLEDEHWTIAGKCETCWAENGGEGCDWAMCGCACHDDDELEELPPEQSAEALGFTGELDLPRMGGRLTQRGFEPYAVERERRAPWWEAEQRAAYESLGFDYPSGLMARVRETAL